jgi:aminoglycoside phosphotransferase (APT) family kinase protein
MRMRDRRGRRHNASMEVPVAEGGNRLLWADLPTPIRDLVEAQAGGRVVAATSQPGGFSPGLASRLLLADGRRVFAKAVSPARNPDSPDFHRREALVLSALPAATPTPRLLWSGELADWVVLIIEDVVGRSPAQPWRPDELDRVLVALAGMAATLTPNPVDGVAHMTDDFDDTFDGWRRLAEALDRGTDAGGLVEGAELDPWVAAHLDRLVDLEFGWPEAVASGQTLVHCDVRADNLLLTESGVVVVDWPNAAVGPPWIDLLFMLPSGIMHGLPDPEVIWRDFPPARDADPHAVTTILTALTGYFVYRSLTPPPHNLPTVRAFQAAQGRAALGWLRRRLNAE